MTPPSPESESDPQPAGTPPAAFSEGALPVSRESVHFIRRLMQLAPDIVHVYDFRTQKLLYVNQRLTDVLGYTEADLPALNYSLVNLVIEPDPSQLGSFITQRMAEAAEGETVEYEFTVRHKDGSPRVMRTRGSVLRRDETGQPLEVVGVSEDVTAERQALAELRRREAQLAESQRLFQYGNWEWEVGTDLVRWSDELVRIFGYDPARISGVMPFGFYFDHIPGDERAQFEALTSQIIATHQSVVEFEHNIITPTGERKRLRVRGTVVRDLGGRVTAFRGTSADSTAEYEAAGHLRQREALLRETEALFQYGSWEWEVGSGTVRWSEGLFRMLDYDPGEWPDSRVPETLYGEHLPGSDAQRYHQCVDEALASRAAYEIDHWVVTRSGARRRVRVRGSVQEGESQRLVGTVTDITEEYKATERLREGQTVRDDVERFFGYGSWVWDLTGEARTITWSAGNARLFGYEPNEIPDGRVTMDFLYRHVHPDDLERLQSVTHEALRRRDPNLTIEFRIVTKQGQVRHVLRRARLVLDEEGHLLRYVGHNADVTDERQLADQLSRSEELNRRINELSPDFISIFSVKTGRNRYIGRQLREVLGYSEKEVERHGGTLFFALEPDGWDKIREFQARIPALTDGEFLTYQVRLRAKDGHGVCIRSQVTVFSRDEAGLPLELMAITQDVTEQEENAEALRRSEALNRKLVELSPDFIHVLNLQTGKNQIIGQSLYEWLGYSRAEYEQHGSSYLFAFADPQDVARRNINLANLPLLPDGEFIATKTHLRTKDGRVVVMHNRATVFSRDADGLPLEIMSVSQDVTEPESQTETLRQSEAFNRRLLSLSPDVIGLYNLQTRRSQYVSAATLPEWFGYTPDEVEALGGNLLGQFWDEDEKKSFETSFAQALQTMTEGAIASFLMKMRRKDGSLLMMFVRMTVIRRDEAGHPLEVMSIYQNVTEREHLIDQLRRTEILLSQTEESLLFGSWEWDVSTGQITWSAGLWRIFGYDDREGSQPVTTELFLSHLHPDDRATMQVITRSAFRTPAPFGFEYRISDARGQPRLLAGRGVPLFDESGRLTRLVGNTRDVTAEVQANERIEKQTYLLREAESLLNFGSWEWDVATGEIMWSEGLYGVFGYGPGNRPERITFDFYQKHLHPDEMERAAQRNQEVMRDKGPYEGQYRILTPDGQERWVHEKGMVITNAAGTVVRLMGSTADVTQLKQYQTQLEKRIQELDRSNADLERFAYVASHDLQEPLRKITSFADRLTKRHAADLNDDGRLFLERMVAAAVRMQGLIDNLLAFSRITRQSDAFESTDLNAVLSGVLGDLEVKISEKGAVIEQNFLPTLEAVPGQMQQVVQNLISNALKFSQPGRPPVIRLLASPLSAAEKAQHRLVLRKKYVKICVEDNGIGFEPHYAERIFVLFQRLHGRSEYEGTGIGLAIVKKIVENHQGAIFAESSPGQGARFIVLLPLEQERAT